eukprot:CCRYP_020767-RA/>CCRYP_020767-RA protein AED:0.16 eAED:0.16 QI:0/0/0/1/1/1/2/0/846
MKACGIQPTRQVLDNEISAAYKLAITASGMTYQLVPPDDHRRNIAEKAIQTWKDHFIAVISGTDAKFPSTFGANYYHKWNANSAFYGNPMHTPTFPPIRISTAIMTTTHTLSSPGHGSPCPRQTPPPQIFCPTLHQGVCHRHIPRALPLLESVDTNFTHHPYLCHSLLQTQVHHQPLCHPCRRNHSSRCKPISSTHKQSPGPSQQQSQPIRSHPTTNPNTTIASPQHNATHYQQHSPNATHPSSPAAVSDYDSDSSDSDDESITIPHPVPRLPLQPPRVSPQQTMTPRPRVSAPPSSRHTTRAVATYNHTGNHPYTCSTTPEHHSHHGAATRQFPREALSAILDTDTGELLEYRHLIKNPKYCTIWKNAYGKELGRLAQGIPGTVKGTNTIVFIAITKSLRKRRRASPTDASLPTTDRRKTLIAFDSQLARHLHKGARFMTIDIKDFYLNTPMVRPEYMRLKLSDIPDHIIKLYKLDKLVTTDGYVYVLIQKGMYGLPQAGIIAQQLLEKRLALKGYHQSSITPGFWKHDWRPISFTLCVDDFGVKYVGIKHAQHLLQTLNEHYETSQDWKGERYLGLTIAWDYTLQQVQLSMPGYCKKAGHRFHHPVPIKPQHQPYPHTPRTYGAKQQFVDTADDSALLSNTDKTFVQEVIGVFLYYARAVDCTMLPALGSLATQQAAPTQNTMSKIHQFLDYAMTHPDAMITYRASNMILAVHSDASYLSETKARSRAGGHFFLSEDDPSPRNNGAILTLAQIIKPVMSSAADAELGELYINARETIPQRHLLNELGHPQPPTPIQIDNSTALGVVTNIIQPKRTKAMDMRFHWLRCRENQNSFAPIGAQEPLT